MHLNQMLDLFFAYSKGQIKKIKAKTVEPIDAMEIRIH